MSRGHNRERQVKALLEAKDYWVARAAGSLGDADLIAMKAGERPTLIEVKSTAQGPWEHFGPKDREDLLFAAHMAGARAVLCWWPPRGKPQWFEPDAWPVGSKRTAVVFDPLGGASRGIGRCFCAAGPGTNPACQVHP